MRLYKQAEKDGVFLFRWRSYLPLIIVPVALIAVFESELLERTIGEAPAEAWEAFCVLVSLSGLAVRWVTIGWASDGTSGRNTKGQRADSLNTDGLYSVVRNPLYLGNFLALSGIVLSTMVWWFMAIAGLLYWLYIERIIATEEAYLSDKFGAEYEAWTERTPAFLPAIRQWRTPAAPFRFRKVLRQEFYGLMSVASGFFALEVLTDLLVEREGLTEWLTEDLPEVAIYLAVLLLFLTLRFLKKRTRVLDLTPQRR